MTSLLGNNHLYKEVSIDLDDHTLVLNITIVQKNNYSPFCSKECNDEYKKDDCCVECLSPYISIKGHAKSCSLIPVCKVCNGKSEAKTGEYKHTEECTADICGECKKKTGTTYSATEREPHLESCKANNCQGCNLRLIPYYQSDTDVIPYEYNTLHESNCKFAYCDDCGVYLLEEDGITPKEKVRHIKACKYACDECGLGKDFHSKDCSKRTCEYCDKNLSEVQGNISLNVELEGHSGGDEILLKISAKK